jgi:hypothetical protein
MLLMVTPVSMLLMVIHNSKRAGAAAFVTVRVPRHVGLRKGCTLTLHQDIGTAKALRSTVTSCSRLVEQLVHLGEGLQPEAAVLLQLLLVQNASSSSSSSASMLAGAGRVGRITQTLKLVSMSMITGCQMSRGQQQSLQGAAGTASPPWMLQ